MDESWLANMLEKMLKFIKIKKISTLQLLLIGYLSVILVGTLLLMLPFSSKNGSPDFINALFTAVSATCVTGLVVLDTATQWTFFGQIVILCLIQIGGLGILAFITIIQLVMKQRINLSQRLIIKQDIGGFDLKGIVTFVRKILLLTLLIEGAGAIILATQFVPMYGLGEGLWYSIFHSISAFCNAGFDLFGDFRSLTLFQNNPVILYTIGALIILGGLGFFVFLDLGKNINKQKRSFHTRIVLLTTGILLLLGIVFIGISEYNNVALAHLAPLDRINNIIFMAITPRTAGFASLNLTDFKLPAAAITVFLMFVGGSPGSTAGGIKTTTLAIIVLSIVATIRKREAPEIFHRRVSMETLQVAQAIGTLSLFLVGTCIFILTISEPAFDLLTIMFEAVSAFGTVGLSLNMTTELSMVGKFVIMLLMFLGRVGPLTFALSVMKERKGKINYPDGRVLIG